MTSRAIETAGAPWPADLLFLLDLHPRDGWANNPALGELAHFWLHKHASLNSLAARVGEAGAAWREGAVDTLLFRANFVPHLRQLLGDLEGHHQVEDQHYFPQFRRIEPRLARGFDILEGDHGAIHERVVATVEAARAFLQAEAENPDALRRAAERYVDAGGPLIAELSCHLTDEEDLVIPLIAARLR
jgi:iron-sulfur cluster repair protein YtfE (RIC family)